VETLLSISLGLALSAACGFRVFVPLLVLGAGAASGQVALTEGFGWLGSEPALIALTVATLLEIAAYYIPWVDNLLDTVATPVAVVAGVVVTASVVTDMDPLLRWGLAVVAGGGIAGTLQTSTTLSRAGSTVATGGLGNPLVATGELLGAAGVSLAAVFVPVLAFALAIALLVVLAARAWRRRRRTTVATA
jgi:hypothetical protein